MKMFLVVIIVVANNGVWTNATSYKNEKECYDVRVPASDQRRSPNSDRAILAQNNTPIATM